MTPNLPRYTLIFTGIMYLLLGRGLGGAGTLGALADGGSNPDAVVGVIFGLLMFAICAGVGVGNLVVAWGLGARKKWAWWAAMALGVIYLPSGCLPFGLAIVIPLFNDEVKAEFGI